MTRLLLILVAWIYAAAVAQAQSYPLRPITITVTAAPGGVTDVVGRAIGQRLSESWGQQVVIENKGGGAHVLGAAAVAKSAADGYSLLLAEAGAFVINPTLYGKGKLPYDEKDFIPITGLVRIHQALLGHPSLAATNVRELIALARKLPGELTYATAGIGSALHMNMVLFASMAGLKLQPVHYRGAAPALADVIAGHVSLMSLSVSAALPPAQSGQVRIFGIGSPQRLAAAPDIPTVAESGLPGYEASSWFGLFAPAGTPREIVLKINKEVTGILDEPEFREKFLGPQIFEPMASSPEEFADYIEAQKGKWSSLIRQQHLTIQ
ncbi:MAG TPA: tripartite tricarboxylate transporter substrate-binding protein [Xanthobacteraceae bacterium]|jgi:tripartite-type tricarboxylate transporter receptor subunit TctC